MRRATGSSIRPLLPLLFPYLFLTLPLLPAPPASAREAPARVARKRKATLNKVCAELAGFAKLCAKKKAYAEARAALRRCLLLDPSDKRATRELGKLVGRNGAAKASLDAERRKTHAACAKLLEELALFCEQGGYPEGFELHITQARTHFGLEAPDLAYFAPYLTWVRKADLARLEAGGERVDGRWLTQAEVGDLDARHRSWSDPWVLADEVHEVKTTMPLRTARRVLAHVGRFRRFFLSSFADVWELRPPKGRLPVLVTATQAELQARAKEEARSSAPGRIDGAAYYLWSNLPLNPCFVTFEPMDASTGETRKIGFEQLLFTLRHELSHQIAFEYTKYDANAGRKVQHHFWAVEGLAEFMHNHVPEETGWRLSLHRKIPSPRPGGYFEGNFSHCQEHLAELPTLAEFFAIPKASFSTMRNYHMGATVVYFLLHGENGKYRARAAKLIDTVHRIQERPDSFRKIFRGVDPKKLQAEWETFVRSIPLEK